MLTEFGPRTRVSVSYLSPVALDFQDTPENTGVPVAGGPREIDLGMTVPQGVMVSAYHEPNDEWALMADFGWQQWTEFGKVDVTVSSSTTATWRSPAGPESRSARRTRVRHGDEQPPLLHRQRELELLREIRPGPPGAVTHVRRMR